MRYPAKVAVSRSPFEPIRTHSGVRLPGGAVSHAGVRGEHLDAREWAISMRRRTLASLSVPRFGPTRER